MTRVIVTGLIAQHRWMGGVAWDYLNVLIGFKQLGYDVYYFEDSGEWPYLLEPANGSWIGDCPVPIIKHLNKTLAAFELKDKWAYRYPITGKWYGITNEMRKDVISTADMLINVSGTLERPEEYRIIKRLIYIDTDPVFTHIRLLNAKNAKTPIGSPKEKLAENAEMKTIEDENLDSGLLNCIDMHDIHFTVGETLRGEFCNTGHNWLKTKHPIALDCWKSNKKKRGMKLTTVMNWSSYAPIAYKGEIYGQKDIEMRKFMKLPSMVPQAKYEIALSGIRHTRWETKSTDVASIDSSILEEMSPAETLEKFGWKIVDAVRRTSSYLNYRTYIEESAGEFSIAKHGYVKGESGWFSGRSACYLAAGKPVVVQDTGFELDLLSGKGVLAFKTLEEAGEMVKELLADYPAHSKSARELSFEYFDSAKVIRKILEKI